jgi:hypothetical protein
MLLDIGYYRYPNEEEKCNEMTFLNSFANIPAALPYCIL